MSYPPKKPPVSKHGERGERGDAPQEGRTEDIYGRGEEGGGTHQERNRTTKPSLGGRGGRGKPLLGGWRRRGREVMV